VVLVGSVSQDPRQRHLLDSEGRTFGNPVSRPATALRWGRARRCRPEELGFPPLLLDLEAGQDTDHVITVYRLRGLPEHLLGVPHARLLTGGMIRTLSRVDRRSLDAGLVGYRGH